MKYFSRKFLLAAAMTITGCVAFLFYDGKLTGGEFITLVGIVLGSFTAGDVALNAIHKRNSESETPQ
jgi:hypothetical protein